MPREFVGKSLPLTAEGITNAALSLSVNAQEIWAVLLVETSGCGFLPDRRPQILFERHLFHRFTRGKFGDGDISDPSPGGYGSSGAHQYERLAKAIAKDRKAALRATSWGLGQVLGDNCKEAGFTDAETMVQAMCDSEDAQLAAVVSFLKKTGLDRPLRVHDWTAFAQGYNGRDFAKNHYDIQLRGEFQRLSAGLLPDLELRTAQLCLSFLGIDPGPVDGVPGSRTRAAVREFQGRERLKVTGEVDDDTLAKLREKALS